MPELSTGKCRNFERLDQRLTATQSGAAFNAYGSNSVVYTYGYDSAGQLTAALGSINSVSMSGRQYQYGYDQAGNRASANHTTVPALAEGYTLNTLNQIGTKENTTVAVQGSANATGVLVTANGVTTTAGQAGGYWGTDMNLANAGGPATGTVSILAGLGGGGPGGTDLVTSTSVNAFLPAASETMGYDQDGNLQSDGIWDYTWNAENQLTSLVNVPAQAAGVAAMKIAFTYDYLGRRVEKQVYAWVSGAWQSQSDRRFVYDGWNVIAELDAANGETVVRHFIWGLDLSGSTGAMGGIGALLMIQDGGHTYFPAYDGGGNVVALMDAANGGSLAAAYEYTPFGQLLRKEGIYAASNPLRWSTKWWDEETGDAYYGARYYSPRLGRFLNQDPIQEKGGINLYGFCGNDPINYGDYLGMNFFSSIGDAFRDFIHAIQRGLGWVNKQVVKLNHYTQHHYHTTVNINAGGGYSVPVGGGDGAGGTEPNTLSDGGNGTLVDNTTGQSYRIGTTGGGWNGGYIAVDTGYSAGGGGDVGDYTGAGDNAPNRGATSGGGLTVGEFFGALGSRARKGSRVDS